MIEINCPLREAALISPKQSAIIREGLTLTFVDLDRCVQAVVEKLCEAGIKEGDKVGIFLQNDWYYPVLVMALIRLGAIACPLSTRLPKEQLQENIELVACPFLIAVIQEGTPSKELWGVKVLNPDFLLPSELPGEPEKSPIRLQIDRPATILFTSGSTGEPKAVLHSLGNHYYSAEASNSNLRIRSGERWLLNLPMYHVSGLSIVFRCLLSGAGMVFPWHKDSLEDNILLHHVTHLSVVPTQLQELLDGDLAKEAIDQLEGILVGGAPAPKSLLEKAMDAGLPIYPTYGLTEMASQVTTAQKYSTNEQRLTAGRPLRFHEIAITDEGEIHVRGKTLFQGFVEGESLLPGTDGEGWYHTGDLGSLDDQGYLTVLGRKDNQFISGGENIQPEEIERVLAAEEDIQQALVVPVPDKKFGQRPCAFVLPSNPKKAFPSGLPERLKDRLPKFKIPDHFLPWPADEIGLKVSRKQFAELAQSLLEG